MIIDLLSEVSEHKRQEEVSGQMRESLFTRKLLLYILLYYDKINRKPRFSYGYVSTVKMDYWGVGMNMLEDIIYPLGINLHEALAMLEESGPEGMLLLQPSENFIPLVHERKILLRIIQQLMAEATGSDRCRSQMSKRLGWEMTRVSCDFRSNAKSITLHLVEQYCNAAGVKISAVFQRYFELYSTDESKINYAAYPALTE